MVKLSSARIAALQLVASLSVGCSDAPLSTQSTSLTTPPAATVPPAIAAGANAAPGVMPMGSSAPPAGAPGAGTPSVTVGAAGVPGNPVSAGSPASSSAGAQPPPAAGSGAATGAAGSAMATAAGAAGTALAAAAGSSGSAGTPAADSCPNVTLKVGDQSFDIASKNGQKYSYILSVPKSVDPTRRAPLVVHWHALSSDPEEARSLTSVDAKAEAAKTLVVYPRSPDKSWDVGSCCTAVAGGVPRDEEVFARELIKDVLSKACVDGKRIYTNGFSNGGMISQMLACKMGDVFAAGSPMGSTLTISQSECKPSRPIPLLLINGTEDPLVGYRAPSLAGGLAFTADTSFWAKQNGCTGEPEMYVQKGQVTCQRYTQCSAAVEVAFCSVEGMGHCVPGMKKESASNCLTKSGIVLGMPNDDIDAVQMDFDFMLRFTLP